MRMCSEDHNQAAQVVNSKLSTALDSLTKSLPQSRVVYVDIYNPLLELILHPQNYGELSSTIILFFLLFSLYAHTDVAKNLITHKLQGSYLSN